MLPAPGVFHFPWEISSGAIQEGTTVRTFGRLKHYQPADSRATLSSHYAATQHQVVVHTGFVEPFHPILEAQYIVLGELEITEGKFDFSKEFIADYRSYFAYCFVSWTGRCM